LEKTSSISWRWRRCSQKPLCALKLRERTSLHTGVCGGFPSGSTRTRSFSATALPVRLGGVACRARSRLRAPPVFSSGYYPQKIARSKPRVRKLARFAFSLLSRFLFIPIQYIKAGPVKNNPNSVTARGKPKRRRARPFFEIFGAAPPRDVTLLHVQPIAALWGAPKRAQGVRYCPGGVLIRSSDCHLRYE